MSEAGLLLPPDLAGLVPECYAAYRPLVLEGLGFGAVWSEMAGFLAERAPRFGLPEPAFRETLEGVGRQLRGEVRLDLEQAHLAEAARSYEGSHSIPIPRLLPFCTPAMTAMERVRGWKAPEAPIGPPERLRAHPDHDWRR